MLTIELMPLGLIHHSCDPDETKGEPWAGAALRGRSPVIWAPMKGALRAVRPRRRAQ